MWELSGEGRDTVARISYDQVMFDWASDEWPPRSGGASLRSRSPACFAVQLRTAAFEVTSQLTELS